jgi:hypothetical protein
LAKSTNHEAPRYADFSTLPSPHPSSVTKPTLYFSLFPRLKIKLQGRHFDTIDVIGTESQAVLNTHTEHDFQDAF